MSFPLEFCPSAAAEFPNDNPALHGGATWVCLDIGGPVRAVVRPLPKRVAAPAAESTSWRDDASPEPARETVQEAHDAEDVSIGWPEDVASIIEGWLSTGDDAEADIEVTNGGVGAPEVAEPVCCVEESPEVAAAPAFAIAEAIPDGEEALGISIGDVDESQCADAAEDPSAALTAFIDALVGAALASGSTRAAAIIPALVGEGRIDASLLDETMSQSLLASGIVENRGSVFTVAGSARATLDAWRDVLEDRSTDLSACGTTTLDVWGAELLVALGASRSCPEVRRELRRRGVAAFGMLLAA